MRVLLLTKYGPLGASSRLRTLQYVPAMRARGWDVHVDSLLPDEYVQALYSRRPTRAHAVAGMLRRLRRVFSRERYDVAWVEKEVWPWLPMFAERRLLPRAARWVADYDDAIFHLYDQHRRASVRRFLGAKIDAVMARADLVVAGNDYLAARARSAGARRVEIVPTVIDLARYGPDAGPRTADREEAVPVIGWIGSPDTVRFLAPQFDTFARLAQSRAVRCVAIGARPDQLAGTVFEPWPWSEATEVESLRRFDIGTMPLQDTLWQRGKCGYKLIQYMGCGLPVVASPVGVNRDLVDDGVTGYLAESDAGWLQALTALIDDPALRRRLGAAGRRKVEDGYSLQVQAPRLLDLIESVHHGATR